MEASPRPVLAVLRRRWAGFWPGADVDALADAATRRNASPFAFGNAGAWPRREARNA